jgi:hypothetical protein
MTTGVHTAWAMHFSKAVHAAVQSTILGCSIRR